MSDRNAAPLSSAVGELSLSARPGVADLLERYEATGTDGAGRTFRLAR